MQNAEELKQTFRQFPDAFEAYSEFYKNLNLILLKRCFVSKFDIPEEFQSEEDEKTGENVAKMLI